MLCYDVAVSYPGPGEAYSTGQYVTAPPPMGYPSKEGTEGYPQQRIQDQTTSRGDGFWKGWSVHYHKNQTLLIFFFYFISTYKINI